MAFSKILIANRGEIACRIARTAHELGYRTVAVYSDADAGAHHVRVADEAVRIGPPPVRESYLDSAALISAARKTGADAVHPGYGFLSENEDFAQACRDAGLVFIGPSPASIKAMGNKAAAKRLMIEAGVPCVPGYQGSDQSDERLTAEARRIGLPVMVKAAAGGGGRGMRLVAQEDELARALSTARSEALNAFGSGELILEKAIVDARHVEVQVFADRHGHAIHLGERDCSVQRRHQKVIEEAPSPAVSAELRARMGAEAVAAARAIQYEGAGTVEFLLGADGHFYFLEMNTRLQVEHPVTEAITGLDLVEWQLRVAAGEPLPLAQEQVRFTGHAIEVRLYAEDPARGFLPQSGCIVAWELPAGTSVRTDHGVSAPYDVTPYYDPMLAKVIAHGVSREEARRRLVRALDDTVVLGITTNRRFLMAALEHPVFAAGDATTSFIGAHFAPGSAQMKAAAPPTETLAVAAVILHAAGPRSAPATALGWRSTGPAAVPMRLAIGKAETAVSLAERGAGAFVASIGDGAEVTIDVVEWGAGRLRYGIDGVQRTARFALVDGVLHLDAAGATVAVRDSLYDARAGAEGDGEARIVAPMNGRIVAVHTKPGDAVKRGQRLVVLEAMKMQHEITAGRDGKVATVAVREGDQVATRQLLVDLEAAPAAKG
jgi:geranyl-CoA carboxylase alpha subunit